MSLDMDDGKWPSLGVIVSLLDIGNGQSRLITEMSGRNARCEKGDFVVLGLRVTPVIALGACRRLLIPP